MDQRIALLLGMLSSDQAGQDRAKRILLERQDRGKSWLKGEWKDETGAAGLGLDIGAEDGREWIEKTRDGMEAFSEVVRSL